MKEENKYGNASVDAWQQAVNDVQAGCFQTKIFDYFNKTSMMAGDTSAKSWEKTLESSERNIFFSGNGTLTSRIEHGAKAGELWFKLNETEEDGGHMESKGQYQVVQETDKTQWWGVMWWDCTQIWTQSM